MKKLCVIAVSATVAVSAGVLAYNEIKTDDLFSANVEALSYNEDDYAERDWYRYDRPDGGFNCTYGGNEDCL